MCQLSLPRVESPWIESQKKDEQSDQVFFVDRIRKTVLPFQKKEEELYDDLNHGLQTRLFESLRKNRGHVTGSQQDEHGNRLESKNRRLAVTLDATLEDQDEELQKHGLQKWTMIHLALRLRV